MSSVWTGMACEAGREERGPKMREPLPFDLHWSNLEEERKREKEEGRKRGREKRRKGGREEEEMRKELPCVLFVSNGVKGYSPQLCY